jgi:hypothetical protein
LGTTVSYQDPNQPYGAPPQQQGQQGQMPSGGWGQQSQSRQQGSWGRPGGVPQQSSGQQQQAWGAPPQQGQGQIPQQPYYGSAPGFGQQGQSGPQDYPPQQFNQQQGYGQPYPGGSMDYSGGPQGYPGGPQGYIPQADFGSGANYGPGPGYPMPSQGSSGLATAALWLGILGGWGIINLVISILAIRETGPGKKLGRNKAVTGLILTIAWAVVWTGIFVAFSNHASNALTSASAPTSVATAATGAAGAQATGASSDPGCQAAQTAFNTYSANAESGGLGAIQTLGNALVAAAGESHTAASQLKTTGQDYLALANENTPPNMVTDLESLDSACGMSFNFG